MKHLLLFSCLALALISCNPNTHKTKDLTGFIPDNSAFIIKTKTLGTLESDLKNSTVIKRLSKAGLLDSITKQTKAFDSLKIKDDALICISNTNDISYITRLSNDFKLDSATQKATANLHKIIVDSVVVASTSKDIINRLDSNKTPEEIEFTKLYKAFDKSPLTVFVNQAKAAPLTDSIYKPQTYRLKNLSNWMALDADVGQDYILLNGVSVITDTLPKLLNVFKNTTAKTNRTASVSPQNIDGFISLTFDNFQTFYKNLQAYNGTSRDSIPLGLFKNAQEIGLIYKDDALAIAIRTLDIIETKDALLDEQNIASTFRQTAIFNYSKTDFFKTTLQPFVHKTIDKYTIIEDVVVFSNSEDFLNDIIAGQQNKKVVSTADAFQDAMTDLSSQSSMLMVANTPRFKLVLEQNSSEGLKGNIKQLNLDDYPFCAVQFIQDNGFLHTNAVLKKNQPKAIKNTITEQFSIVLDNPILTEPQIVKNHLTGQKEIVVQDVKNNLYLISNRGNVLWKKQLRGNILGQIEQIDMYKNGRLQLAFATPHRVYVLDRNGKNVAPFPLKFNDKITQPLSVFDYDNRKNYRLLVTQDKHTLMFDDRGHRINGFKFQGAEKAISTQPHHFRIGMKDYIVFAAGNTLEILNRTGHTRINVKQQFDFSDNDIYLYNNTFSFTNTQGELVQVNQKGHAAKQNLMLGKKHTITTTSKTLVALDGNKLTIKSKTIDLDFGNYTKPKIFYLRDKIYIAVTDLQAQKAYLFDSQARPIDNFPVYGTSTLQLDNMDRDRNLEFVVKGEANNIILYQIN